MSSLSSGTDVRGSLSAVTKDQLVDFAHPPCPFFPVAPLIKWITDWHGLEYWTLGAKQFEIF